MKSTTLIYEDVPRFDSWVRPLVSGFITFFIILGLVFLFFNDELAIAVFVLAVFLVLLFVAVIPRRFQIYEDRLRIQLGGPIAYSIPLEHIDEARHGSSRDVWFYWGIRFGTSTSNVIEIVRNRGMNTIITPAHFHDFLNRLNQAVRSRADKTA